MITKNNIRKIQKGFIAGMPPITPSCSTVIDFAMVSAGFTQALAPIVEEFQQAVSVGHRVFAKDRHGKCQRQLHNCAN